MELTTEFCEMDQAVLRFAGSDRVIIRKNYDKDNNTVADVNRVCLSLWIFTYTDFR